MPLRLSWRRTRRESETCGCPCHRTGSPIAHPVPCCVRCPSCETAIPNGVPHLECAIPPPRLVHGFAKYDTAFAAFMGLFAMALALYAAGPASPLLLGASAAGLVLAVVKIRHPGRPRE